MKYIYLFFLLFTHAAFAQNLTQTVRGRVVDAETKSALPGASFRVMQDSSSGAGVITDPEGYFKLTNIPVGRRSFRVSCVGYNTKQISNLIVVSGKETVLAIELESNTQQLREVRVSGRTTPKNEMALLSSQPFSVEETGRYAASRDDPARMASNFAGVQGSDDSRNDIVIRGNSPQGLLWRLEGVNIPNPSHFVIPGSQGGSVTMLNSKTLGNSEFFTGAFPAEYGNALAGVFDLSLRSGNNEKTEGTLQAGLLGLEGVLEGPISRKNRSSFLVAYRYSTLDVFQKLGIQIGTSAVPNYQDLTFKLNFPTAKAGTFSVFGIGGTSAINIVVSKNEDLQEDLYADKDRDQYFRSSSYTVGVKHDFPINATTYLRTIFSHSRLRSWANHDLIDYTASGQMIGKHYSMGYDFKDARSSINSILTKKLTSSTTLKTGVFLDRFGYSDVDSILREQPRFPVSYWERRWDYATSAWLVQPFAQVKVKASERLTVTAGINALVYTLNSNSKGLDPRAGLQYTFNDKESLSLAYGMHHQTQASYTYFIQKPLGNQYSRYNENMGLTRNQHWVLGYNRRLSETWHLKAETYYQRLAKIPVSVLSTSSFSLLNQGSTFSRAFPDSLENTGVGYNVGVELTLEKQFSKNYYALFTASLYDSKYRANDQVWRNTDYNGRFALNALAGGEWPVGKRKRTTLLAGGKVTWAGGRRYGPLNVEASLLQREVVFQDALRNTQQFPNYFRMDLKLGFRKNALGLNHELGIDLINISGRKNVLGVTFVPIPGAAPSESYLKRQYQLGFLPLFYYKVDF
ncbi:TonB-dependent receptor [Siphonobacter sp. SORGH_AS_0500]|uniref:TonB-dependent receptor n=1 Tax=Siphonobacter sp. SORGH_AS_0500 TaxID=1864824 RepID=UPI0028655AE1|nr:TonB-dependent receptor [Siphonobacter sp. SORGH_AS_0500]MDR6197941.1 hypothetical protein [Siphonobacter sp. SORGH_AS_0500]